LIFAVSVALPSAQTQTQAPAQTQAQTQPQAPATAGAKKAITVADYSKWRSVSASEMSDDGKWVAFGYSFMNTLPADAKPVLHILNLETKQKVEIADATGPSFSNDSMWIAYTIDPGAGGRGRGRGREGAAQAPDQQPPAGRGAAQTPPRPRRVELRNLATGAVRSWENVQSFTFAPASTHLVLRRRPAAAAGGAGGRGGGGGDQPPAPGGTQVAAPGGAAQPAAPRGVDVTIHNLKTGRDQLLASVAEQAFNKNGTLFAYTVDDAAKDANGLFVFDLSIDRAIPLENDAKSYNRMAWDESGRSLAVLKGVDVEKMRERANVLVVYPDVLKCLDTSAPMPAPVVLDPAKAADFPKDWVVSDRAGVNFSDDGSRVFFGIKAQEAVATPPRRNTEETADVDVWNTADERIQSVQMIRAEADRNFTYRSAFVVGDGRFVKLADPDMRDVEIAVTGRWAVGRDTRAYVHDYKRPAADLYRIDTMTGERTLMMKAQPIGFGVFGIAPTGKHFLYWKDNRIHAFDLDAAASRVLGGAAKVDFTDVEFDRPGPKPAYGLAGYEKGGAAAIANHRHDLWRVPLDGSDATNVTNGYGTKNEIRLRIARTVPQDPMEAFGPGGAAADRQFIDFSKPQILSAYGEWTKKAGFFELANGQLREIVYEDASFSTPMRALKGDRYMFTRQTFVEYPDLRISGADFRTSEKITDANPQQAEYLWGKRVLFDYKNKKGVRLQGILAVPDDYKPGERRPMIVAFYEKNSQNMHRYTAPSFISGMGSVPMQAVTEGYLTMMPDVHFNTGSSHSDMLDCVEAAVKKVIEMGYADPKRIGVTGHSYGGEGAAFIGVRSKMFAAVGMGAGVTDLYSDFTQSWGWTYQVNGGSGANAFDYYLYGQGRWGFTPWDNPEVYRFESAITHVKDAVAPFLIMHGTADPTVSFTEGLNFYQALRYFEKPAVLLAYPNEGHGLRGLANRRDLTVRFFEFFNHYLKGAPAPKWLSEGVPFLKK
jgi:dipeptidyl aminopeptidase/acylaminoacyl peptidase